MTFAAENREDKCIEDYEIICLFEKRNQLAIYYTKKKYYNMCYKVAYNILQDFCDVEECINQSCYKLWESIPPAPNNFKYYLKKIVTNEAFSIYRKNIAQNITWKHKDIDDMEWLSDDETPESFFDERELIKLIEIFVDSLSYVNRMIFTLRSLQRYKFTEIAKLLDLTENQVTSRYTRLRRRFEIYIKERGYNI